MKIGEIFRTDLDREIKEVIKVDHAVDAEVADELREYVVTGHIHEAFVRVLDHYQESINAPSEAVNVWVSGFFGSGKSSFAKVSGYVLSNPDLEDTPAADILTGKLATTQIKALLNTIHAQAPTMTVFVDLSASRNVAREGEAVVLPLYRELLTQLDYPRDLALAELEITLEADGKLAEFVEAFRVTHEAKGHQWRDRRDKALALNEASAALHTLDPDTYSAPDSYARTRPTVEVTNNWFAKRALELLARRRPHHRRLVFVVDEVGQYASRSVQRMLDVQGLAQAFQKEHGRLWFVATSQETLEDVVSALGDNRVELPRMRDRFPLKVDLVPSDIEEVVSRRVLDKTDAGAKAVRGVYERHQHQLRANVTLDSPTRGSEFTREEFARVYPLLPYQIQLFIDAVSGLRAHGGAGPLVGGANRTLIRLAHQLVKTALVDREVGALTTVPMAYDLMEEMIPTSWRSQVEQVAEHYGQDSVELHAVKTVALAANVHALKLDEANIAVLTHPAADAETKQREISESLQTLVHDEILREGEDGYRLQSPEERDWEKARNSRALTTGPFNRLLRERYLADLLGGLTAAAGGHKRQFRVEVRYDDEKIIDGDVVVRVYEGGDDQVQRAVERSRQTPHENDIFLVFRRSDRTWRNAEQVYRSNKVIGEVEARSLQQSETKLLHEERLRQDRYAEDLRRSLAEDLASGQTVFRGTVSQLVEGSDYRSALTDVLRSHLAEIYTRLDEFAASVKRSDAAALIRADDLSGLPDYLGPEGLRVIKVGADGYKIDEAGPCEQVLSVVRERKDYGSEATGKYLETFFEGPPFGAELDVIMVAAAAAVRAGLLTVGQGGSWFTGRSDARLEQVFTTVPKFRAAVFRIREELDINLRTRVAKLLHQDLVGDRPGMATEQLAAFAREHLDEQRERIDGVRATLRGMRLQVPEVVDRAGQILSRMRKEEDETLVQSLDAGRLDLKDGIAAARDLIDLLENEQRYETLRVGCDILSRDGTGLSDTARDAWDRGREILRTRTFVDRFAELRSVVETIRSEHLGSWERARDELATVITDVTEQAEPLVERVSEAERVEFENRLRAAAVPPDAEPDTGPSVGTMRMRAAEVRALIDELRAAIGRSQGRNVRRVAVRDLFSDPIRGPEELDAFLERIRNAAEEAFNDGEYFLLS